MALGSVELTFTMLGRDQLAATLKKGEAGFKKMGKAAGDAAESSVPWGDFVAELRGLPMTLTGLNQGFQLVAGAVGGAFAAVQAFVDTAAQAERARNMERTFDRLIPRADAFRAKLQAIAGDMLETSEIDRYAIKMDLAGAASQDTMAMFAAAADLNRVAGEDLGQVIEQMMGTVIEGDETMSEWLGTQLDLNKALEIYALQVKKTADELTESEKVHARMLGVTSLLNERQKLLGNTLDTNDTSWQRLQKRMEELPKQIAKTLIGINDQKDGIKDGAKDIEFLSTTYDKSMKIISMAVGEMEGKDPLGFAEDAVNKVEQAVNMAAGVIPRHLKDIAEKVPLLGAAMLKVPKHVKVMRAALLKAEVEWDEAERKHRADHGLHTAARMRDARKAQAQRLLVILETSAKDLLTWEQNNAKKVFENKRAQSEAWNSLNRQDHKLREHEWDELKKFGEKRKRHYAEVARIEEERVSKNRAVANVEFADQQQHNLFLARLQGERETAIAEHTSRVAVMQRDTIMRRRQRNKFIERSEAQRDARLKDIGKTSLADAQGDVRKRLMLENTRAQAFILRHKGNTKLIEIEADYHRKREEGKARFGAGEISSEQQAAELDVAQLERERAHSERRLEIKRDAQEREQQMMQDGYQVALSLNQDLQNLSVMQQSDEIAVMSTLAAASAQVAKDFKNLKAGAPGAMMALGAVSSAAIRNTRAQAGVQGAFALAESAFMFAKQNYVGGAAAAVAAGMYFAIAGGAGGAGGGKKKKQRTTALGTGGGGTFGQIGGGGGNVTVNVQGFVGSTVDLGVGVARAQDQLGESQFAAGDTV